MLNMNLMRHKDQADSQSMYRTLEEKIIPTYYDKDRNGMSKKMG